jgi:hypothetical protein
MLPRTPDDSLADAMRATARLTEATRDFLRWEWDSRFSAALSVVKSPRDLIVLELIVGLFPSAWDHQTIAQAPDSVRALVSAWGGLMAGQRLFTLDPADDPLFFAAWWPWGGGTAFSLRVSCAVSSQAAKGCDPLNQLRRWFSVSA